MRKRHTFPSRWENQPYRRSDFCFSWPCPVVCGPLFPDQGSNLNLLYWESGVLTTGRSEKPHPYKSDQTCTRIKQALSLKHEESGACVNPGQSGSPLTSVASAPLTLPVRPHHHPEAQWWECDRPLGQVLQWQWGTGEGLALYTSPRFPEVN